jgi:hypothetical protein
MTFCVALPKRSTVRTPQTYLQTAVFFESNCMAALPWVGFRSGATQTHQPTAHMKRLSNAGLSESG